MSTGVIIPAAGQGKRMQNSINKQYLPLYDRPVLAHTIDLFNNYPDITQIVVVVAEEEIDYCQSNIIDKYFDRSIKLVAGGKTRRHSVFEGLKAFSPATDYIIVHDGSRPLLPEYLIGMVIKAVKECHAVTLGVELKDTIKRKDSRGYITETLARDEFVSIQTPQAFDYQIIMRAHQEIELEVTITDDASLVEAIGVSVKVINGSYENIKITTPMDLIIAETILKKRGR
jgi:2-C-methyl-D-erythritol 4-phosphate cytidylyltransferase